MSSDPLLCHQRLSSREIFQEPRIYRRRKLRFLSVEPQTALYVPMVTSPHLLPFLVEIVLVIVEICLSVPWILRLGFFAAGKGGQPEQHCGMQLNTSPCEDLGGVRLWEDALQSQHINFTSKKQNKSHSILCSNTTACRSRRVRSLEGFCWEQPVWGATLPAKFPMELVKSTQLKTWSVLEPQLCNCCS